MVNQEKNWDELIASFLKGEASPEEAMEVNDWINQSSENRSLYLELAEVYAFTHNQNSFSPNAEDNVWKKIQNNTVNKQVKKVYLHQKNIILGLAALLVLALITTTIWLNRTENNELSSGVKKHELKKETESQTLVAVNGSKTFNLADDSKVNLEKGSELVLAKDFNKKDRILSLKGSGEFHVVHNENKPFILSVNKLKIIDVGTIFRVKSAVDTIKIIVDEGAVELRLNNQLIAMSAGDSAFYVIQQDFISLYSGKKARKNKVFEFDGTSLKEVVSVLSEFFERPIVIKDEAIAACPLTVRFKNENLMTILEVIKELMDIQIVNNNQVIELYGKGCN